MRRTNKFWAGLWSDLIIEQVMMKSLEIRGGITRVRGVTESARVLGANTAHRCAAIHEAMTNLTGMKHKPSEKHVHSWQTVPNPHDLLNTSHYLKCFVLLRLLNLLSIY